VTKPIVHEKDTKMPAVEWQTEQKIAKIAVASQTQKDNLGRRASSLTYITRWGFGELLLFLRTGLGFYHPRQRVGCKNGGGGGNFAKVKQLVAKWIRTWKRLFSGFFAPRV